MMDKTTLVITRRYGESFFIGDDVKVEIEARNGNQVKFRITAPRDVIILREELREGGE